jgi:septal ring factor EnvC (AmiA/AmiB activator)
VRRAILSGGVLVGIGAWALERRRNRVERERRFRSWEQESHRLRLEVGALRGMEVELGRSQAEVHSLRQQLTEAEADLSKADDEIEELRLRLTDSEDARRAGREQAGQLSAQLQGAEAEARRLARYEVGLQQARDEIERLVGRLDAMTVRERKTRRELTAQTGMTARSASREETARIRAAGAEALIARRDETIRALEKQLARLGRSG